MDVIELLVGNEKIIIQVKQKGWSNIFFIKDDIKVKLGANGLSKIITKLLDALSSSTERKYMIYKEIEIFTIFYLMEPHATIAGRDLDNSELELICIEDGGNVLPLVVLSNDDKIRWIKQLKGLM